MRDEEFDLYRDEDDLPEPRWTMRRVVYFVIILITLIAFLIYVLAPVLFPPAPPIDFSPIPRQQV
jgi:hypothetical protein